MMDETVSRVAQKTGLSPERAKSAAQSVLEFLKTKLPAPMAENLSRIMSGGTAPTESGSGILGSATSALGNIFGRKYNANEETTQMADCHFCTGGITHLLRNWSGFPGPQASACENHHQSRLDASTI